MFLFLRLFLVGGSEFRLSFCLNSSKALIVLTTGSAVPAASHIAAAVLERVASPKRPTSPEKQMKAAAIAASGKLGVM